MTASPINLSTVPPSARNASVSTEKYRDVCSISTSGSAASAIVVNPWTSVKTSVISCLTPPSLVEMELSMTPRTISLGTKCANDHMARWARLTVRAEFVDFPDMRGHRHEARLRERLKLARLRRNASQGLRHRAAEHPDNRKKGRANDDRENQPLELELPDVLDKVILGGQQQYAAAITFAEGELRQPEQVIPSVVITDGSFVVVEVV